MTELLTIDETAALLKLSDRTVYEMLRGGRLPGAAKVSGKWRVDRDKLIAWLAKGGELAEHDAANDDEEHRDRGGRKLDS